MALWQITWAQKDRHPNFLKNPATPAFHTLPEQSMATETEPQTMSFSTTMT